MRRFALAALVLLVAPDLGAQTQLAMSSPLPPIPSLRQFNHWGTIEQSYDDEEQSTSIALSLPFDDAQRATFAPRASWIRAAHLDAGFVHAGKVMTAYPDVVTLVLKLTLSTEEALRADKKATGAIVFTVDSTPMTVPAPLVGRNAANLIRGRAREVEDTYVVVLSLSRFLTIVNGAKVSARLHEQTFELTGGPLEGMRDLASRMVVSP